MATTNSFDLDKKFISASEPLLKGNEKKYLIECVESGWISSQGPFIKKFESSFSKYVDRKYGVAVSNGTIAIDIVIEALGIGKGDEVIMPAFAFISAANAIVRAGAVLVLVDCDPFTWNMNVNEIESKINSRTKAIMVVHNYGLPVEMDLVLEVAKKHNLFVIEDAAEVHGQTYKGKKCGSFGIVSTFSFFANKNMTMGEGGIIVTDDDDLFEKCSSLRNLCVNKERRYKYDSIGWNARLTNMQAAIGLAQLEQIDKFLSIKELMGKQYTNLLNDIACVQLPVEKTSYAKNNYWGYGVVIKDKKLSAKDVMRKLFDFGIDARPFFWPVHLQPCFLKMGLFKGAKFPITESLSESGFCLPNGLALKKDQINYVCEKMHKIFE
jgi:perosamine synthetase